MHLGSNAAWKYVYNFLYEPDVENRLLIRNRFITPLIVFTYLLICLFGKYLMPKKKKSLSLKYIVLIYNVLLVFVNWKLFQEIYYIKGHMWNSFCPLASERENVFEVVRRDMEVPTWDFFLSKIVELLDTVFFVLSGNLHLVTFLHVFHHSVVVLLPWCLLWQPVISINFLPAAFMNTAIHVLMYSYYFLAALGPSVKPFLWWKKYLTSLQILQFVIIIGNWLVTSVCGCWPVTLIEIFLMFLVIPVLLLFLNY